VQWLEEQCGKFETVRLRTHQLLSRQIRCSGLIGTAIANALLNAENGSFQAVVGYNSGSIFLGTGWLLLPGCMLVSRNFGQECEMFWMSSET